MYFECPECGSSSVAHVGRALQCTECGKRFNDFNTLGISETINTSGITGESYPELSITRKHGKNKHDESRSHNTR